MAEPVYVQPQPQIEIQPAPLPMPAPVTTVAAPPMPQAPAMQGPTTQVRGEGFTAKLHEQATIVHHHPPTSYEQAVAPPQHVQGRAWTEEAGAQVVEQHQELAVTGQTSQNVVEIPTVQEMVEVQEVPEVMINNVQQIA